MGSRSRRGETVKIKSANQLHDQIRTIYAKLRANPVSILVGRAAEMALRQAKIIAQFRSLEARGLVRISSDDEQENYFDVYGKPDTEKEMKQMQETLNRMGCKWVYSEWFDGENWNMADSIGMCVYEDAESPFENGCVADLMEGAINQLMADLAAYFAKVQKVAPNPAQVLAYVCRDGLSAEQSAFPEWAADYGYDSDSIKAKTIYDACLEEGHKARRIVSGKVFEKMAKLAGEL